MQGSYKHHDTIYPFADAPDVGLPIIWYPVSEETPPVPFAHPFTLRAWDEREQLEEPVIGTRYGPREKYFGPLPAVPIGDVCGTAEQWLEGFSHATWLAGGYDVCDCPVFMPFIQGGAGGDVDDGLAELLATAELLAQGGDVDDGRASFQTSAAIDAEGGDVDDGVAELLATAELGAQGGDVDDGLGGISSAIAITAEGGDVDDGLASIPSGPSIDAEGGDVDSGIATGQNTGSTGAQFPGTGTDDPSIGAKTWANPGNITGGGGTAATVTVTGVGDTTHYLTGTNFGFAVPVTAQVKGITVTWNRKKNLAIGTVTDNSVRLTFMGTVFGADKATATNYPAVFTTATYGGTSDDWGTPLLGGHVNDLSFGVVLSSISSFAIARTVSVDFAQVDVNWMLAF